MLANGGQLPGKMRFLKQETINLALSDSKICYDHYMNCNYGITKGGFCDFKTFDRLDSSLVHHDFRNDFNGFYGWGGVGGSLFMFHPTKQIGLAYVMNGMHLSAISGQRTDRIVKACQKIIKLL